MSSYTSVTVIYNPNSTGNGKQLADDLKAGLQKLKFSQSVELVATKHAGHATEIAYKKAMESKRALVISASGDGGYNEVVNGLIKAQLKGAQPVAGLLPAGNANDHFNNVQQTDVSKSINEHQTQRIDLLKIKSTKDSRVFEHYGHSYIGLGLTPKVGKQLNQTKLNRINEVIISLKTIFFLRPTKINQQNVIRSYYSIIAANLSSMSKVLKLSEDSSLSDGKFELVTFEKSNKLQLLKTLLQSAVVGLKSERQLASYKFKTIQPTLVQVDGEIFKLDADSQTEITNVKEVLECLS